MVWTSKTYHCDKCSREYSSYDAAHSCEIKHIVDDAVNGFKDDLAAINAVNRKPRKSRARLALSTKGEG